MDIYKTYCNVDTPVTKMLSKRGFNLPTYESLKSSEEIKKILESM
jgi:dTDP-4-amino-4,6-dideoxygalactose transaminase